MEDPTKRNLIDWEEKNKDDNTRLNKRIQKIVPPSDDGTPKNDGKEKKKLTKKIQKPLLKLRKKIPDLYDDEEEDEEEEDFVPFFNISLLEDKKRKSEIEQKKKEKNYLDTIRITKEQEMAGKLNMIMNSAVYNDYNKDEENLPAKKENNDEKPSSTKKKSKDISLDELNGSLIDNIDSIIQKEEDEKMAELILEKSGRKAPKKSISEIVKDIQRLEQLDPDLQNIKDKK